MALSDSVAPRAGWRWLALAALLVEALLFTVGRGSLGRYGSPVALLLSAVVAVGAAYAYTRHGTWQPAGPVATQPGARWAALAAGGLLGLWVFGTVWQVALKGHEILISSSDIIPSLAIYTKRWLAGEEVYRPFTEELGYPLNPTYLPAMWGPYLLPEWLRFDYRLLSGALFVGGVGAYLATVWRLRQGAAATFGLAALPFLLACVALYTDSGVAGFTIEYMVIGYYLILLAGVLLPSRGLRIAGLLLCLLSRYALVLWVPLYLGLLYFQKSKREALLTAGLLALGVGVLFVLPFLTHDWQLLSRAQESYTGAAIGEWQHLNDLGQPMHLSTGMGMGIFFFRYAPGELLHRVVLLQRTQLLVLVLVVGGAALLYWRQQQPRTDYRVFAVLALKLYLAVFYAFIQVPYYYLCLVSLFCSLFVLLVLLGTRPGPARPIPAAPVG